MKAVPAARRVSAIVAFVGVVARHLLWLLVGIDGEALLLDPPLRFRILPGALRVRIPAHAPGSSPAAAVPTSAWSTLTALLQTAAGRPVTIGP
jgi:hypothetical protein